MHKPSPKSIHAETTDRDADRQTDRQTAFQLYIVDYYYYKLLNNTITLLMHQSISCPTIPSWAMYGGHRGI